MTGTIHSVAASVPGYCTSGTGIHTPGQWATCAKLGWREPTTTAANAGAYAGHNIAPILIVLLVVLVVIAIARGSRSGSPATSK